MARFEKGREYKKNEEKRRRKEYYYVIFFTASIVLHSFYIIVVCKTQVILEYFENLILRNIQAIIKSINFFLSQIEGELLL